jgi:hypothetical protein
VAEAGKANGKSVFLLLSVFFHHFQYLPFLFPISFLISSVCACHSLSFADDYCVCLALPFLLLQRPVDSTAVVVVVLPNGASICLSQDIFQGSD